MNTLKSAAVVVVLLVVLYGVYVALNKPDFLSSPSVPSDVAPPVVEFGPAGASGDEHTAPTSLAPGQNSDSKPAGSSTRTVPGGSFQPNLDTGSMPPPAGLPSTSPPAEPTAGTGGLARSNFESPAAAAGQAPPLETPAAAPPATAAAPAAASSPALTAYSLKRDWQEAERLVGEGKFKDALAKLSPYHGHPDLPPEQRPHLTAWLDALAAKVIYSREHLLAAPYRVRKGETLFDVSNNVNVPWPLLFSINRGAVNDPQIVVPGTELKVVPGPFRSDINLATSELTLFLGDLYAGRFPLALGDQPPPPGAYQVRDKKNNYTYYGLDGRVIPGNDPANPYGGYWISLGGEVSIHGSPLSPTNRTLGCVSLSPQDAKDVYSILSLNSEVTIRR